MGIERGRKDGEIAGEIHKMNIRVRIQYAHVYCIGEDKNG